MKFVKIGSLNNIYFQRNERTKFNNIPHPYIICVGDTKRSITQYALKIEDSELIYLSQGISFIEAFDYLVKSYYIYNYLFPENLETFFYYVMNFIYEIKYEIYIVDDSDKDNIKTKKKKMENNKTLLKFTENMAEFLEKIRAKK